MRGPFTEVVGEIWGFHIGFYRDAKGLGLYKVRGAILQGSIISTMAFRGLYVHGHYHMLVRVQGREWGWAWSSVFGCIAGIRAVGL